MTNLQTFSDELAAIVETASPVVVQVHGGRRPVSGVVYDASTIVTNAHGIRREDGLKVRLHGSDEALDVDLAGWDPATGLAILRTRTTLSAGALSTSDREPRPGEIAIAVARSWSNAVTASTGIVAVVGGPLRTGRRRQIPRVFRITAQMHDGFAGGGVFDASGRLIGIATASAIRGFGVGIPISIAWAAAAQVLKSGTPRRGFVGVAAQRAELTASQRPGDLSHALVIVGVTPSSPAESAGILVGDVILEFDGKPVETPDELLDALIARQVGQTVVVRLLRGGSEKSVTVTIAERPKG
jgi:S1-C subfamily serine protease